MPNANAHLKKEEKNEIAKDEEEVNMQKITSFIEMV